MVDERCAWIDAEGMSIYGCVSEAVLGVLGCECVDYDYLVNCSCV